MIICYQSLNVKGQEKNELEIFVELWIKILRDLEEYEKHWLSFTGSTLTKTKHKTLKQYSKFTGLI